MTATGLHHHGRAFDVEIDVGKWIGEAEDVVDLARQMKYEVLASNQVIDRVDIEDIAKVGVDLLGGRLDVEQVPAVSGDHRVDDRHARAQLHQGQREVASDEAHAACDEGALTAKFLFQVHGRVRSTS